MSKQAKELKWFQKQKQVSGVVTQLKEHYYDHKGTTGLYRPYPFEVDYETLLYVCKNQKLVDAVKEYITNCYFDAEGKANEYAIIKRIEMAIYKNSEESIHQNARDWLHISFDNEFSVHIIAGPIGTDHVIENTALNKALLYSMSKML